MAKFRNWQGRNGREWYSRGYLPHRDKPGLIQGITFHLGDSLSSKVLERLKIELSQIEAQLVASDKENTLEMLNNIRRQRINAWLDAGHGRCLFKHPELATCVRDTLLHGNAADYELVAWCVMPNHVHVIAKIADETILAKVVKAWKSVSSRKVMAKANLSNGIWGRDYFDRYIRDDDHLRRAINYTEHNPVKAKLVKKKEDWEWSSAWKRK